MVLSCHRRWLITACLWASLIAFHLASTATTMKLPSYLVMLFTLFPASPTVAFELTKLFLLLGKLLFLLVIRWRIENKSLIVGLLGLLQHHILVLRLIHWLGSP